MGHNSWGGGPPAWVVLMRWIGRDILNTNPIALASHEISHKMKANCRPRPPNSIPLPSHYHPLRWIILHDGEFLQSKLFLVVLYTCPMPGTSVLTGEPLCNAVEAGRKFETRLEAEGVSTQSASFRVLLIVSFSRRGESRIC